MSSERDAASHDGTAPLTRRWAVAALLLACAVAALPVVLVAMPPLLDYPNHVARLWLIAGGARLPSLAPIYAIDWSGARTNIAIDLAAAASTPLGPIAWLPRALLLAALLLPAIGAATLGRAVQRQWCWWQMLALLPAWGAPLLLGFLNFEIACGLALLAAAGEVRRASRPLAARLGWRIVAGVALIVAHPFGLLFYAALIGGLAIGPAPLRGESVRAIGRAARRVLPLVLIVALFAVFARHPAPDAIGAHHGAIWLSLGDRLHALTAPFRSYRAGADIAALLAFVAPVVIAQADRSLHVHTGLLLAAAGLAVGALLMPEAAFDTGALSLRLPTMAWLTLTAALRPGAHWPPRRIATATLLALAAVAARTADIGSVWRMRAGDAAAVGRALAGVPAGARVLPLDRMPVPGRTGGLPLGRAFEGRPTFWHLATLAVPERQAFVPTLFAHAGKQVLRVRAPYDRIAIPEGTLATVDRLGRTDAETAAYFPYLSNWPCFDFILVLDADLPNGAGPLPAFAQIRPLSDQGFARLYRISHDGPARCAVAGLRSVTAAGAP